MDLSNWRIEYDKYSIDEKALPLEPFSLFNQWFQQALDDKNPEPNAFTLSTCSNGICHSRIVLLKEIEEEKFVFYTNYNSQKGKDMEENPKVSLLFFFPYSQRQIRILGSVDKLSREKAIAYFKTRPEESQISAMASAQSSIIEKDDLIKSVEKIRALNDLTCPEHWGGYGVSPYEIEFWQGQPARLHDRIVYKKTNTNWKKHRLAP